MNKLIYLCLVLFMSSLSKVHAGDPCPITYHFYDAGVPKWLDRDITLGKLNSKAPWLGITFHPEKTQRGSTGMSLSRIHALSPAKKAGLEVGDIITEINGKAVLSEAHFDSLLAKVQPNQTIQLTIERGEQSKTQKVNLTTASADPLLKSFLHIKQDCTNTRTTQLSKKDSQSLEPYLFTTQRGFRCKSAHKRLLKHSDYDEGDIVFIRGSRRVLMSVVGFDTTCVNSADYDGSQLTKQHVQKLFNRATKKYTQYSHANP